MLGAIVGDIVGSVYEWNNIKSKDFPLFRDDCHFTDDTVMTCAVAEGIMNGGMSLYCCLRKLTSPKKQISQADL